MTGKNSITKQDVNLEENPKHKKKLEGKYWNFGRYERRHSSYHDPQSETRRISNTRSTIRPFDRPSALRAAISIDNNWHNCSKYYVSILELRVISTYRNIQRCSLKLALLPQKQSQPHAPSKISLLIIFANVGKVYRCFKINFAQLK